MGTFATDQEAGYAAALSRRLSADLRDIVVLAQDVAATIEAVPGPGPNPEPATLDRLVAALTRLTIEVGDAHMFLGRAYHDACDASWAMGQRPARELAR